MTKSEMITEVLNLTRWSDASKASAMRRAMTHNAGYIEYIHSKCVSDKEHALYYATLLNYNL